MRDYRARMRAAGLRPEAMDFIEAAESAFRE